jgi:two-component system chemotaxis response regulator CheB
MSVCEAQDKQQILRGHVYVAPGDQHLSIYRTGAKYHCRLTSTDPVNRHRPSVDVLFDSVAKQAGRNAVGVILTGMGIDGAKGLLAMREAGAPTVAQDEATSVVWGMPGSAVQLNAAGTILPLAKVAEKVLSLFKSV